jgi:hypothetical protein
MGRSGIRGSRDGPDLDRRDRDRGRAVEMKTITALMKAPYSKTL